MTIIVCVFLLVKDTICLLFFPFRNNMPMGIQVGIGIYICCLVALNVTAVSQAQDRFLINRGATDHKSHSSDPLESQIIFPISKCALSPKKVINSFYEITCAI